MLISVNTQHEPWLRAADIDNCLFDIGYLQPAQSEMKEFRALS
jgi:hypothetical protein